MDIRFCCFYEGDGYPPTNRFCRTCRMADQGCNELWQRIIDLSESEDGDPVPVHGTRALLYPHPKNWNSVRLMINCTWYLPKEDFLHFIATGHAGMGRKGDRHNSRSSPSMTRQEPYVHALVEMIGGWECPSIVKVKRIQKGVG
jgi:hypothetical protein